MITFPTPRQLFESGRTEVGFQLANFARHGQHVLAATLNMSLHLYHIRPAVFDA